MSGDTFYIDAVAAKVGVGGVMRVIAKGRSKGWTRKCTCSDCGAKLEVQDTDCRLIDDQRDGDYYAFACPECKSANALAASLVRR